MPGPCSHGFPSAQPELRFGILQHRRLYTQPPVVESAWGATEKSRYLKSSENRRYGSVAFLNRYIASRRVGLQPARGLSPGILSGSAFDYTSKLMLDRFRHAICNDLYEKKPFAESCRAIRATGYAGIEIAPFTLDGNPASIPASKRREYSAVIRSEGLEFVGLHWLLVSPAGLHATTPDITLRRKTWEHLRMLVDLCADLGPRGVMVFGSPKQRSATGGLAPAEATRLLAQGLADLAPHAIERGVTILLEALPSSDTDVVTSLDEAARIVRDIGSEAIRTMFDCHNAVKEREPHAVLVDRHFDLIRHVHLNELDGRHPATGAYDYKPVLEVLSRRGYSGWLSLEVFDFTAGADRIASESLRFLESEISKIS